MSVAIVGAAIWTFIVGIVQIMMCTWGILVYHDYVIFPEVGPLFMYIRILYFHNADSGSRIQIGHIFDGMPTQAFALVSSTPAASLRTLYINYVNLGIGVLWLIAATILLVNGSRNKCNICTPFWIAVTMISMFVDFTAMLFYINDVPHVSTLQDLVAYAGGVLRGAGNNNPDAVMAAWVMAMVYIKFIVIIIINIILIVAVVVASSRLSKGNIEAEELREVSDDMENIIIPRASTSLSAHSIPELAVPYSRSPKPISTLSSSTLEESPIRKAGKYSVKFPMSLLSIPQRVENIMSQSELILRPIALPRPLPDPPPMPSTSSAVDPLLDSHGRRNTAVELKSQLPWSYMPHSVNRARLQQTNHDVPPPVPVPDYTLHPSYRKASVHRADGKRDDWRMWRSNDELNRNDSDLRRSSNVLQEDVQSVNSVSHGSTLRKVKAISRDIPMEIYRMMKR